MESFLVGGYPGSCRAGKNPTVISGDFTVRKVCKSAVVLLTIKKIITKIFANISDIYPYNYLYGVYNLLRMWPIYKSLYLEIHF